MRIGRIFFTPPALRIRTIQRQVYTANAKVVIQARNFRLIYCQDRQRYSLAETRERECPCMTWLCAMGH